jgi:hypothetical protein
MAEINGFGPSLNLGGAPAFNRGGSAVPRPVTRPSAVSFRAAPAASVAGGGAFRFPAAGGVGNFRTTAPAFTLPGASFITRDEADLPAVLSLRTFDIVAPKGGEIDVFV